MTRAVMLLLAAGVGILAGAERPDEGWLAKRWRFCNDPSVPVDIHIALCTTRPGPPSTPTESAPDSPTPERKDRDGGVRNEYRR
jgi:hypothetical protein